MKCLKCGNILSKNSQVQKRIKMFYVYILLCSDMTYYTGYTQNLKRRINQHQNGKGARYTRTRTPIQLYYVEKIKGRSEAMKRERQIKRLNHQEKEELIKKNGRKEIGRMSSNKEMYD